jgi:hypothetical protein
VFVVEDHLDTARFNAGLWAGLAGGPEPVARAGADLSGDRAAVLAKAAPCARQIGAR